MAQLSREMVQYLAKLCRIACSEEEEKALLHDLKEILGYVDQLNEISTEGVIPCNNVSQNLTSAPLRKDIAAITLSREEFLKAAPKQVGGIVCVPRFQKEE